MEQSGLKKDRIFWIDIAKGILIFIVFWGHIETTGDTISTAIFSMHMPAFFVLSGYTFKYIDNFKKFLSRKAETLLFPYFFFCIIGACIHLLYGRYELFGTEMLRQLLVTVQPDYLYSGGGWFLIALFWANIYMYIWVKYFEQFDLAFKLILAFIIYYIASNILYINSFMNIERIPLKIDSSFMAFFFMLVGFYLNKNNAIQKISNHKLIYAVIFGLAYVPLMKANGWCNVANCVYNNYIFYFVESVGGTLLIILLSMSIEERKRFGGGGFLSSIGRVSLPMFMAHGFFMSYMINQFNIQVGVNVNGIKSFICTFCLYIVIYPIGIFYNYAISGLKYRFK